MEVKRFEVGSIKLEIHQDRKAAGEAAARSAAEALNKLDHAQQEIGVIFATGASQLEMLHALTSMPGLPWKKVLGFHLDEYVGIAENHPASFRRYLRENLTKRVPMAEFSEIDGSTSDTDRVRRDYVQKLHEANPQLCLLGIGENGHLAFNDPPADLDDPLLVKVVTLDDLCRQQQVDDGCFNSFADVPRKAITLTVPMLLRGDRLFCCVPGANKSAAVRGMVNDPIGGNCPATALRTHPRCTIYLDRDSGSGLD